MLGCASCSLPRGARAFSDSGLLLEEDSNLLTNFHTKHHYNLALEVKFNESHPCQSCRTPFLNRHNNKNGKKIEEMRLHSRRPRKSDFKHTSNPWPSTHRSDALTTELQGDSWRARPYTGSYVTRVLHTARISNARDIFWTETTSFSSIEVVQILRSETKKQSLMFNI